MLCGHNPAFASKHPSFYPFATTEVIRSSSSTIARSGKLKFLWILRLRASTFLSSKNFTLPRSSASLPTCVGNSKLLRFCSSALPLCRAAVFPRFRLSFFLPSATPHPCTSRFGIFGDSAIPLHVYLHSKKSVYVLQFARSLQRVRFASPFMPRTIFTRRTRARFVRLASACFPHVHLERSACVRLRGFSALCTVPMIHGRYRAFCARSAHFTVCALTCSLRLEHVRTPPILSTSHHCTCSTHAHHLSHPHVNFQQVLNPSIKYRWRQRKLFRETQALCI